MTGANNQGFSFALIANTMLYPRRPRYATVAFMRLKFFGFLIVTLVLAIYLANLIHPITVTTATCGNAIMQQSDTCHYVDNTGNSYDKNYGEQTSQNALDANWPYQMVIWGILLAGWYGGKRLYHRMARRSPDTQPKSNP
jgi:hypothetical protein